MLKMARIREYCNIDVEESSLDSHPTMCRTEEVACQNKCGEIMPRYTVEYHLEHECNRKTLACKFCSCLFPNKTVQDHEEKCGLEFVECKNNCGLKVERRYVLRHLTAYCSNRFITCSFCNEVIRQYDMEFHEQECDFVLSKCEKCGVKVQTAFLSFHYEENCKKKERCDFCGCELEEDELPNHLKFCELMPIVCENKCGKEVTRQDLKMHLHEECPKRVLQCEYCQSEVEVMLWEDHCSDCSKSCAAAVKNETSELHWNDDSGQLMSDCTYKNLFCEYEGDAASIQSHIQKDFHTHLQLMKDAVDKLVQVVENQNRTLGEQEAKLKEMERLRSDFESQTKEVHELQTQLQEMKNNYEVVEHDGSCHIWKITEFLEDVQRANLGPRVVIPSPAFHSSRFEYLLNAKLYINKTEANLSLYIQLDVAKDGPGIYENLLTCTIIDHGSKDKGLVSSVLIRDMEYRRLNRTNERYLGYYFPSLASLDVIQSLNCIVNDTLCIEISVEPSEKCNLQERRRSVPRHWAKNRNKRRRLEQV